MTEMLLFAVRGDERGPAERRRAAKPHAAQKLLDHAEVHQYGPLDEARRRRPVRASAAKGQPGRVNLFLRGIEA